MTADVVTSAAAEGDIRDIADYIGMDSATAAGKFGVELLQTLALIGEFPRIGRPIRGGIRARRVSGRFWRYLILYREDGRLIQVLRVLHGATDIGAVLGDL